MIHARHDAKAHARAHMRGIWAAALMPFTATGAMDEDRFTHNIRHWTGDLRIDGVFVAGKQGEFFSMSIEERKRAFTLADDAVCGRAQTIMSCSDQNMDVVIDLARQAQSVGAEGRRMKRCWNTTAPSLAPWISASSCVATPTAAI